MPSTILIESEYGNFYAEVEPERVTRSGDSLSGKAKHKLESAMNVIKAVGDNVIQTAKSIAQHPDELEVKIGLKFSVEAGAIIAKTATEGNLEVTIKWKK